MSVRLTPLNMAAAAALVYAGYGLSLPKSTGKQFETVFLLVLALVVFIADQLFRYYFKTIRQIWLVEFCFIIFAVIVFFLINQF